jgi:DNA 3'-phosphatase
LVCAGCSPDGSPPDEADSDSSGDKADSLRLREGSAEALAVLRVANEATREILRGEVGLPARAADNLVAYRAGEDESEGTSDDRRFATLAELDGVPQVGPSAIRKLLEYARRQGYVEQTALCETDCPPSPERRQSLEHYDCPAGDADVQVAFFDADSTLRVAPSGAVSANAVEDVHVLPFAAARIADLNRQGYLVAMVSNQMGVSQGHITLEVAEAALVFTARQLARQRARVDHIDFAERNDEYRKPRIGMALRLEGILQEKCGRSIDRGRSIMVGDSGYKEGVDGAHPDGRPADDFSNSDRLFAENLGVAFFEPTDFFGWRDFGVHNILAEADLLSFLSVLEAEVARLQATGEDPAREKALAAEVSRNRAVNGL